MFNQWIFYVNYCLTTTSRFQLRFFDKEPEAFADHLAEFPVTFPPSYPFEEKLSQATSYMQTRCPGWCDRVLFSHTAKKLITEDETVEYDLMGRSICMGDHKVRFLHSLFVISLCISSYRLCSQFFWTFTCW